MLHRSFSVLDTDLFIFSVPSSPFHTQISSPDAMAGAEAAEDVALPGNLWVKTPHTPREAVTWTVNVLFVLFLMSHRFYTDK